MAEYTKIVNKQLQASIKSTSPEVSLEDNHMFAINWLDLRRKWMYTLYTYFAFPIAQSIGAKAIFKGYQTELLVDSAQVNRQVLLLVRYPGPDAFLGLVSRKFFQLVSLLRINSVKNFNLGFAHLLEGSPGPIDHSYLVYHFQGAISNDLLDTVKSLCATYQASLFYAGLKVASLSLIQSEKTREVPLPMDGLIVISHTQKEVLLQVGSSPEMQQLMDGNTSNYLSLFRRVL